MSQQSAAIYKPVLCFRYGFSVHNGTFGYNGGNKKQNFIHKIKYTEKGFFGKIFAQHYNIKHYVHISKK